MGAFFFLFLCVAARLVDLQILRAHELTQRGMKQWTRSGVVSARRGDIVDRNGRLLAQSITSYIVSARVRDVTDAAGMGEILARELGLDAKKVAEKNEKSNIAPTTTIKPTAPQITNGFFSVFSLFSVGVGIA